MSGTFHGYDGYEPGPVDELIVKRMSGELTKEEFEAALDELGIQ